MVLVSDVGTICECGLAKSYHDPGRPHNLVDHEYRPRYTDQETDAGAGPQPSETAERLVAAVRYYGGPESPSLPYEFDRILARSRPVLDAELLARAEDIVSRRHHDPEHGPYRGLDNDPILASMMREEAAELAAEYDRLSAEGRRP